MKSRLLTDAHHDGFDFDGAHIDLASATRPGALIRGAGPPVDLRSVAVPSEVTTNIQESAARRCRTSGIKR